MKNYKMLLQYDGSRYDGWQKQGNTENTIQGKLEHVLGRMVGSPVEVMGSGRTDAGVHALGQIANAKLNTELSAEEICDYLNRYLPDDIAVLQVEEAPQRFHSRLNAVGKTYLYRIETAPKKMVFERKYIYGLGERLGAEATLDLEAMKKAAGLLCGTHDFRSFCSNKNGKKSTVRTVESIEVTRTGTKLEIRMTGNGFLYNMVRIVVGTLIETGLGKRSPESVAEILEAGNRQKAGYTAPPEGLFLEKVFYPEKAFCPENVSYPEKEQKEW